MSMSIDSAVVIALLLAQSILGKLLWQFCVCFVLFFGGGGICFLLLVSVWFFQFYFFGLGLFITLDTYALTKYSFFYYNNYRYYFCHRSNTA